MSEDMVSLLRPDADVYSPEMCQGKIEQLQTAIHQLLERWQGSATYIQDSMVLEARLSKPTEGDGASHAKIGIVRREKNSAEALKSWVIALKDAQIGAVYEVQKVKSESEGLVVYKELFADGVCNRDPIEYDSLVLLTEAAECLGGVTSRASIFSLGD